MGEIKFGADDGIKILNGSDANDIKVGGCYYMSIGCDQRATDGVNEVREALGLPADPIQRFHFSMAVISPSWMPCHPKSAFARSDKGQASLQKMQDAFTTFRHGHSDSGFAGWNSNTVTNWTTHSNTLAEWGKSNNEVKDQIKALDSSAADFEKKKELESKLRNFKELGFCKPVGPSEAIKSVETPPIDIQEKLLVTLQADTKFVEKRLNEWGA